LLRLPLSFHARRPDATPRFRRLFATGLHGIRKFTLRHGRWRAFVRNT
jgi:hypothetical protein